ncbi:hypothetical protein HZS_4783 [Henneguya salminicola]|nr:hypothetical protein HZS_4783 [Henneguya salminicola]
MMCILNKDSREALNIDLENNILIIDEAHNLLKTIESSNSIKLTLEQLKEIQNCMDLFIKINEYFHKNTKYRNKDYQLVFHVSQLHLILNALILFTESNFSLHPITETSCVSPREFLSLYDLENVNIFKLDSFIKESQFSRKLYKCYFKLKGTTSNTKYVKYKIFPSVFCIFRHIDHIVPVTNVISLVIESSPSNLKLDWSYSNNDDKNMIFNLCQSLYNISNIIPCGLICFFPSYNMLNNFICVLKELPIFSKINSKKKIIVEEKTLNSQSILDDYSKQIKLKNGAILLAVMGGKLSEGIDFSDDLCRCVIIMGMPYGNINDFELKLKMDYIKHRYGDKAANEYYQNMCMSSVNQSIGRAIRHRCDYASILLLDSRYSRPYIRQKFSKWIESSMEICQNFGRVIPLLKKFFNRHSSYNQP